MDFFSACKIISTAVTEAIIPLIQSGEGSKTIGIGADNTPTKYIDKVAEDIVITLLTEMRLCAKLISEEIGTIPLPGPNGTIFLDPVDGTHNAIKHIPFYAISLAYAVDGRIIKGYVKDLSNSEEFTAELDKGAYLNGRKISVSDTLEMRKSTMCIYGKRYDYEQMLQFIRNIRRFRQLGASALELSYVAAGRIDAFIDLRNTLRVTDAAAGVLICQEAGGKVSDLNGDPLILPESVQTGTYLIATNGHLHQAVIAHLR